MRFYKVAIPIIIVLAGIGGGTYWYTNRDQAATYITAPVTQGNISVAVTGAGNLALSNTASITFPSAGKVGALLVDVGQTVTKGQQVLTLDPSYYQDQMASLQTSLLQAKRNLIQAQINVQSAETSLIKVQTPYTAAQIAATLDTVNVDQANVVVDQTNLTAATTANDTANIQKWTAKLTQDNRILTTDTTTYQNMLTATPDPNQLALAQINLQISQGSLADAQTSVNTAQANIDAANAPPTGLVAPFTGIVTSINAVVGNTYQAKNVAMVMANTAILTDTIQVSEANIYKIKSGQDATVTISSTGVSYPAKITFISSSATTSQGVVSYRVTVTLTQGSGSASSISQLKAGLTANVSIIVAQSTNALLVPNAAITTVNGESTVQVLGADGKVKTNTVTTGLSDIANSEITSGLSLGDHVIIGQTGGSSSAAKTATKTTSGNLLQPTATTSPIVTVPIGGGGGGGIILPTGGFTPPAGGTTR